MVNDVKIISFLTPWCLGASRARQYLTEHRKRKGNDGEKRWKLLKGVSVTQKPSHN